VISSGFEEADAMQGFAGDPALHFIKKPYTASGLLRTIRMATDRR
jgi:hypothetical protein